MKYVFISFVIFYSYFHLSGAGVANIDFKHPIIQYPQDTTKLESVIDLIDKYHFEGVIILDNREIYYDNQFLFDPLATDRIKEISIRNRVPLDSIIKYGNKAKYGMLIMKTK